MKPRYFVIIQHFFSPLTHALYSTKQEKPFRSLVDFENQYEETKNILGVGREGREPVVEVIDRINRQQFALKKLERTEQLTKACVLQQVFAEECNFIVKIHEIFASPSELYLIMEKGNSHLHPDADDLPGLPGAQVNQSTV